MLGLQARVQHGVHGLVPTFMWTLGWDNTSAVL